MPSPTPTDFVRYQTENDDPLPLIIEPNAATDTELLIEWLGAHHKWVREKLHEHGAILLRGFAMRDVSHFDAICRAISPGVTGDYVGTPANRDTDAVYPSSEGPTMYPIPQHCELMYLPEPPREVFFGCLVPPAPGSGETPLVDNRRVWRELDRAVRDRFVEGGIRITRNLVGPKSRRRVWTLLRWDDFFSTPDREEVEAKCRSVNFDFEWRRDDGLQLRFEQPVTREHPVTGETAWCNQILANNVTSPAYDFRRLHRIRPSFRLWRMWQFVRTTAQLKKRSPDWSVPAVCTYADGSRIPEADVDLLRETVWRCQVTPSWQAGDLVAVDNFAVAHARFPSWGPRRILSCMA